MNKREAIQRKALKFLYGEDAENHYLSIYLNQEYDEESYEKDLEIFKKLYNSKDKDLQTAAWNALWRPLGSKEDFTEEEWAFLQDYRNARDHEILCPFVNPNPAFSSERLILRAPNAKSEDELNLYRKHLVEDGDFKIYTSMKLSRENLNLLNFEHPYCFMVYEKETDRMVGMVGLHHYDAKRRTAQAEWYIFKPFRNKGYGREAILALAKRAFAGKLFEMKEQCRNYTYKRRYAKIDLIRAFTRQANLPSQALAKSCGFVRQYSVHRYFTVDGEGLEDAEVFELTPADLANSGR